MNTELAKRLAAHDNLWQAWPDGSLALSDSGRKVRVTDGVSIVLHGEWYPDLDDPATVGCLWAMLVDAAEKLHDGGTAELDSGTTTGGNEAIVRDGLCGEIVTWEFGETTGEALALALLKAWK